MDVRVKWSNDAEEAARKRCIELRIVEGRGDNKTSWHVLVRKNMDIGWYFSVLTK